MFSGPLSESILKRAQEKGLCSVALHDIRAFATDRHHTCDDTPYGGGGGMVMKPEPIFRSVETVLAQPSGWQLPAEDAHDNLPEWPPNSASDDAAKSKPSDAKPVEVPIILLTPQGRQLNQQIVAELSQHERLALICGRYEGVDERVRTQLVSDEISIGDYVLSGGELAAMVLIDAITRLIPGVLGYEFSADRDSHSPGLDGLLEGPQYTRPHTFRDEAVPEILLSGHHANVAQWRREQALLRTLRRRPEILQQVTLSEADRLYLQTQGWHKNSQP